MASFAAARESFKCIEDQQPSKYITSILEALVPIIYPLCWDVGN